MSTAQTAQLSQLIAQFDALTPELQQWQRRQQKPLKWLYNTFTPRKIRKQQQEQAKLTQQQHLAKCWNELIALYQQGNLPIFAIKPKKQFAHQKIIWQYWGQGIDGDLPEIVKLCFKSVDRYKGDFTVIRLDDANLHEYLEFPDFVWQKRQNAEFKPVFFSDLLRLALLHSYGGVWIDATILLTDTLDKQFISADFFAFQRSPNATNQDKWHNFNRDYFSWHSSHKVNMLSSILFAKKANLFVQDWLQLVLFFWQNQTKISHYFFFQILFNELKKQTHYLDDMPLVDDTLPHLLISKLTEPFDLDHYQHILSQSHIHKLTYLNDCPQCSYYDHLKQSHL